MLTLEKLKVMVNVHNYSNVTPLPETRINPNTITGIKIARQYSTQLHT
jgi:hypothetical protein